MIVNDVTGADLKEGDDVIIPTGTDMKMWGTDLSPIFTKYPGHNIGRLMFHMSDGYSHVRTHGENTYAKVKSCQLIKVCSRVVTEDAHHETVY